MIRLALRLAVSGGRESIVRLALTAVGVAIGTTVLLVAAAADPAIRAQQRHTAWQYTGLAGDVAPYEPDGATDALRWQLTHDAVDGQRMTMLRVAAMGPDSPVPLGLSRVPRDGEIYVSPALAQLIEELPTDRLADRFPQAAAGTIGDDYLAGPDDLVAVIGMSADELTGPPLMEVRHIRTAPAQYQFTDFLRIMFGLGAVGLLLPVVVFIATSTRIGAARREQRFAALRLAGATPHQTRLLAAVEAGAAAAVGALVGWLGFALVRPSVARIEIDGHPSFVDDVKLNPVLVAVILVAMPMLAVVAATVSLRRLQISPLGVARRAVRATPSVRRLVPLLAGSAAFVVALAAAVGSRGIAMLVPVMAAFALMIYGIVAAGPWFTLLTARAIGHGGQRACVLLAGRRLEHDPAGGFRAVSGLVLAVFVVSVFSGVTPALLAEGGARHSSLIAGTTMVAGLPSGTTAQTARAALDAATAAGAGTGIVLHEDPDPERARRHDTRLVVCDELHRFGITESCPTGGTAWLDTSDADHLRIEPAPYTPAQVSEMPAQLVAIHTDGTTATTDRVRTTIQRLVPGTIPWLGSEADAEADRKLVQLTRIANLALAVTLMIAGCSLTVAVAAGIIERKRPFALLRLAGMHLAELQQTALLEAAAPLLLIATASAVLGLGTSAVIVAIAGGIPWHPPTIGYWLSLASGLTIALAVTAAALPLLGRTTAPSAVRFE